MGIEAIGCPTPQKRISAAPPRVTRAGTPRIEAKNRMASARETKWWPVAGHCHARIANNRVRARAVDRADHFSEVCQRIRNAMMAKPIGRTHSTNQTGIPQTSIFAASRSVSTNWKAARHRKPQIAAEMAAVITPAMFFARPCNFDSAKLDRQRSLFSRAAIAPPSMPTIKTMCWTMEMDAGMETCRVRRSTASAKGRTTMVPRARETRTFSARAAGLVNRVVPVKLETCRSPLVASAALITGLPAARIDSPQAAAEPHRRFPEESWCHAFWDRLFPGSGATRLRLREEPRGLASLASSWLRRPR